MRVQAHLFRGHHSPRNTHHQAAMPCPVQPWAHPHWAATPTPTEPGPLAQSPLSLASHLSHCLRIFSASETDSASLPGHPQCPGVLGFPPQPSALSALRGPAQGLTEVGSVL